jgi:hypothetical protein
MISVGKGCVFVSAINENELQIVILQYAIARSRRYCKSQLPHLESAILYVMEGPGYRQLWVRLI